MFSKLNAIKLHAAAEGVKAEKKQRRGIKKKEKRKVQIALQHGVAETEDPDGYVFASGTKRSL